MAAFRRGVAGVVAVGSVPSNGGPQLVTVTVPATTALFATHAQAALQAAGVTVGAVSPRACSAQSVRTTDLDLQSAPLLSVLNLTLQNSDNLYAECFLRLLGADRAVLQPALDVRTAGLQAVRDALALVGLGNATFVQRDGSGLSRRNLQSPAVLTALLAAMRASPLQQLLPVAGQSGTLNDRFIGTPAQGRVFAKTGTMTAVSALSGYMDATNLGPVVFSILVCNADQPTHVVRSAIDSIVLALFGAQFCAEGVVPVVLVFTVLLAVPAVGLLVALLIERRARSLP